MIWRGRALRSRKSPTSLPRTGSSCSPTLLTSCWRQSRKIRSKEDSREPTEDFSAGIARHHCESDDRRLAVARKHATLVAARRHALDRNRRKQVAGIALYFRREEPPDKPT